MAWRYWTPQIHGFLTSLVWDAGSRSAWKKLSRKQLDHGIFDRAGRTCHRTSGRQKNSFNMFQHGRIDNCGPKLGHIWYPELLRIKRMSSDSAVQSLWVDVHIPPRSLDSRFTAGAFRGLGRHQATAPAKCRWENLVLHPAWYAALVQRDPPWISMLRKGDNTKMRSLAQKVLSLWGRSWIRHYL